MIATSDGRVFRLLKCMNYAHPNVIPYQNLPPILQHFLRIPDEGRVSILTAYIQTGNLQGCLERATTMTQLKVLGLCANSIQVLDCCLIAKKEN